VIRATILPHAETPLSTPAADRQRHGLLNDARLLVGHRSFFFALAVLAVEEGQGPDRWLEWGGTARQATIIIAAHQKQLARCRYVLPWFLCGAESVSVFYQIFRSTKNVMLLLAIFA
jgi:hypothetical protein